MGKYDLKEIKKTANEIKPMFNLGKAGLTDTFIDLIDKYLDVHSIVKVKALVAEDKSKVKFYAEQISKKLEADIVDLKGFTFTLFR